MADLIKRFKTQLDDAPDTIVFQQTMDLIALLYDYRACRFTNGVGEQPVVNEAGSNEGSCKLFYFSTLNELTKAQTLNAFGQFYRDDVLNHPNADNHANIRQFMQSGWDGIQFDAEVLVLKSAQK